MKYLYLALSSIILAYIIVVLFTYLYQRKLLYHPSENNYTGDEIQFEYKEVFIEVDKDIKLKSWFLEKDLKKNKTILYFHGNAGDLTNRVHKLNELNKLNVNILIISWRGFSGNPGKPTEKNLYNDARKSVEWLNNTGIENKNAAGTAQDTVGQPGMKIPAIEKIVNKQPKPIAIHLLNGLEIIRYFSTISSTFFSKQPPQILSIIKAIPCPPPIHAVATPNFPPHLCNS